ncbi:MAG: Cell division protein FtsA [Firmicutes bacterium ADurb.Bin419]|nr:MAG: Cell division protein FtsA [Firmicutes bacterium ADurb.Bin419]
MFNKKYLAIDVGNKKTKIVLGGIEKDKIVVDNYFIADTPSGIMDDGKIMNLNGLVTLLKDSFKKGRIKGKHLVLSITGTGIITRDIQLPKSTDEEIGKILEYEAQQYFPVELDNYILDFKVLDEIDANDGIYNKVLLVAVPINQVEEYMKIHKKLNKEIEAIDIPANNICKLLFGENYIGNEESDKDLPKEIAVLDLGAKTTGVHIFSSGKLKFSRILLNGSSDVDELIASQLNIDFIKAEEVKIMVGNLLSDDETSNHVSEDAEISNLIKPAVNNIMSDINRFIEFYNSRSTGNRLDKIYLCGGGSKLKGIDVYFKNYFNIPVEYLNPQRFVVYKGKRSEAEFFDDFVILVNALGCLVRS